MTQKQRVLRLLARRGEEGVTPMDFMAPHVVDGEKPILRLAARVLELRREGYWITQSTNHNHTATYRLLGKSQALFNERYGSEQLWKDAA